MEYPAATPSAGLNLSVFGGGLVPWNRVAKVSAVGAAGALVLWAGVSLWGHPLCEAIRCGWARYLKMTPEERAKEMAELKGTRAQRHFHPRDGAVQRTHTEHSCAHSASRSPEAAASAPSVVTAATAAVTSAPVVL
jgi:hypothetical protein